MTQTASLSLADHFALIIEGLCQAVARRCGLGGIAGPLIVLIWTRLRRIAARFARAATSSPTPSRPEAIITAKRPSRPRQSRPHPLPRRKAWLLRLAPETASGASQLRHFLSDPEVAACLGANPELSRILRPLCHALGIRAAGIRAVKTAPPPLPPPDTPATPSSRLATRQSAPAMAPPVVHPPWPKLPPPPESITALA